MNRSKPIIKARQAALAALVSLGCAAQPAQAQLFSGILSGVTSVVNQVGSKVGSSLSAARPHDIEAERDKFFATLDQQLAGVDPAARQQLKGTASAQWGMAENALLVQNAQLQKQKDGPLVDFGKVARDAAGGVSSQLGMNSMFGGGGIAEVVGGSALDGLVAGVADTTPVNGRAMRANVRVPGMGPANPAALAGGVGTAVSAGVGTTIGTTVGNMARQMMGSGPAVYAFPETADPRSFLGQEPGRLAARDLYRENGFIGWKLVDGSPAGGAAAFAPVLGDDHVKAAVFTVDKQSGAVNAAFRVLKVPASDFTRVVEGLEAYLKKKASYASSGNTLRAVWDDGSFVTADATRVCVGWSVLAGGLYRTAAGREQHAAR
jgi:hypothetical protein